MPSGYHTPSTATTSPRCPPLPRREITGLTPFRNNSRISSYSSASSLFLNPERASTPRRSHDPLAGRRHIPRDPRPPPGPRGGHGGPGGVTAWDGGAGSRWQRGVTRCSPGTALAGTVIESQLLYSAAAGAMIKLTGNAISVLFRLLSAPNFFSFAGGPLCSLAAGSGGGSPQGHRNKLIPEPLGRD